jgi:hypothetical protein
MFPISGNYFRSTLLSVTFHLSFLLLFIRRLDKEKTGLVPLQRIYKRCEMQRTIYTDCLLELLEIEHGMYFWFFVFEFSVILTNQCTFLEGEINFSDFLIMITTYCFFEPREILLCKPTSVSYPLWFIVSIFYVVCFYCFDHDKTGFLTVDDINNLMNMLHNIQKGKVVGGTTKKSWLKLEFKADSLDFSELSRIHDAFPRLFEPAFSLQQNLMVG